MVMDIWNNIPHWELKGWTPNEVMEKYEKTALKPLPASGFPISTKSFQPQEKKEKVGRNNPCHAAVVRNISIAVLKSGEPKTMSQGNRPHDSSPNSSINSNTLINCSFFRAITFSFLRFSQL